MYILTACKLKDVIVEPEAPEPEPEPVVSIEEASDDATQTASSAPQSTKLSKRRSMTVSSIAATVASETKKWKTQVPKLLKRTSKKQLKQRQRKQERESSAAAAASSSSSSTSTSSSDAPAEISGVTGSVVIYREPEQDLTASLVTAPEKTTSVSSADESAGSGAGASPAGHHTSTTTAAVAADDNQQFSYYDDDSHKDADDDEEEEIPIAVADNSSGGASSSSMPPTPSSVQPSSAPAKRALRREASRLTLKGKNLSRKLKKAISFQRPNKRTTV